MLHGTGQFYDNISVSEVILMDESKMDQKRDTAKHNYVNISWRVVYAHMQTILHLQLTQYGSKWSKNDIAITHLLESIKH